LHKKFITKNYFVKESKGILAMHLFCTINIKTSRHQFHNSLLEGSS